MEGIERGAGVIFSLIKVIKAHLVNVSFGCYCCHIQLRNRFCLYSIKQSDIMKKDDDNNEECIDETNNRIKIQ